MEVVIHMHHAVVSGSMRKRVERMVRIAAAKLPRAVDAVVRFEQDGKVRRVEVILHAPKHTSLVASAEGPYFGPAASRAVARLSAQAAKEKRSPKAQARSARAGLARS